MSSNYIDNRGSYFDVEDTSVVLPAGDIVNSSLDSLVVGLGGVSADMLQKWLGLSGKRHDIGGGLLGGKAGRLNNLTDQQVRQILAAAASATGNTRLLRHVTTLEDTHDSLTTPVLGGRTVTHVPGLRRDTHVSNTDPVSARASEPYEFVLEAITGANPIGLKRRIILPLPPEKFMVQREQQSRTFVAINGVEYSLPGPQTLASISLEGMFPAWEGRQKPNYLPKYVTKANFHKPKDLALIFERLMKKGQPLQLTIGPGKNATPLKTSGGLIGVMYVTIVSFEYGEAFGHPGDYVFSMSLKEWRPIFPNVNIKRIFQPRSPFTTVLSSGRDDDEPDAISTPAPGRLGTPTLSGIGLGANSGIGTVAPGTKAPAPALRSHSPVTRPDVTTYVVKQGDTLYDIAANVLGSGVRQNELYALNKTTIDAECKRRGLGTYPRGWNLPAGTRLVIPPKGQRDGTA